MNLKRDRHLALIVLAVSLFCSPLFSQTATTSLRGVVSDPQGAVLPGATVTITNPETGFTRSVETDKTGGYQFQQIPPGNYELNTEASGFAGQKRRVVLLVNTPATVNTTLKLGSTGTAVEVTSEVPTINTQDASVGNVVTNAQIQGLPFEGRDPAAILSLQPGVTFVGNNLDLSYDTRQGSVNGARSDQTNVVLDGVDNNDQAGFGQPFQGALRTPLDSIQELRVTTSNANADAGRSSGAQVIEVTRSGTNKFHGSVYEYNRGLVRAANDWFNKQSQLQSGNPNVPGKVIRNTFGARVGGPIWKDRVYFFTNYEGQRTRENVQVTRVVPTAQLRSGIVRYMTCGAGNPTDCDPAAQTVVTLSPAQLASMDPGCVGNGTCPWGGGANPNVITAWQAYPLPNQFTAGDGLNFAGFTFAAPTPGKLDTYLVRLDANLTPDGRHKVFFKPQMQNDNFVSGPPQFPGQPAQQTTRDNSKGLAVLYTATLAPTLVNNFRYGYIRQGIGISGLQTQPFVSFRGLDQPQAITPTHFTIVPVHNWVDDVSWVRGKHTVQFGVNFRRVDTRLSNNSNSFFNGLTNVSWLDNAAIANTGSDLDPGAFGFAPVADTFSNNYDNPVAALAGLVTQVGSNYNRDKTGAVLPQGEPATRHFRNHEIEGYIQDQWRVLNSLTVTAGVRYTYLQAPYETNGTQVIPSVNLHDWFMARHDAMLQGQAYNPVVTYELGGKANHRPGYWSPQKANFAPRFALAWSPSWENGLSKVLFGGSGKTSIRAGYGMYYDHFGSGLVNTFDQFGSFGLATQLTNSAGLQDVADVPRFTGLNNIPASLQLAAPAGAFPYTPPTDINSGGFAITWGLDERMKTPYSHVMNLGIQRELPKQFVFEADYIGRLGRHLLQEIDLAMPEDLVDPASKVSYFQAATQLAQAAAAGQNIATIAPIPYWENMFPGAAGPAGTQLSGCAPGASSLSGNVTATQAMYDNYACNAGNETTALFLADVLCFPSCSKLGPYAYFDSQFSSLYAQAAIGTSSYHGMQLMLRRQAGAAQFQFNYTLSRSEDMGSNPERISLFNTFGYASQIINSWSPKQLYAPSDWDTRHQINANWVLDLPFGHGKRYLSGAGTAVNQLVSGWQLSGLTRWTSGYPFSIGPGLGFWATNWELTSSAVMNGNKPKTGTFTYTNADACAQGCPNVFADPATAVKQFRNAFPGESGERNNLRGPGIFSVDMSVSKSFPFLETQNITVAVEAFNLTNSARFDVGSLQFVGNNTLANASQFGNFTRTVSRPRVLQFGLRYSF
jgi:Carboxypeptidase regulatory-like domain